ncbi:MAG: GNAT family N-acetyltransferase [Candidatus Dormibacteraeota bacterium]|nr:GNAT family N-acetyltransferase [Candidatus Dormibacteraeota bacterium]
MRPGRPEDLPALLNLMAGEVSRGERDAVPAGRFLQRQLGGFDWESRSRVIEMAGAVEAVVMATARETADGLVARVEVASSDDSHRPELLRWGLALSRAAGARIGQVWRPAGAKEMDGLGLVSVRPFWRMDRPHLEALPEVPLPDAYQLLDGAPWPLIAEAYNRSFAEHWRHTPMAQDRAPEPLRPSDFQLLAVTAPDIPAGLVLCDLEEHDSAVDRRRQPVGVLGVVGTVPEHRRRGLAFALAAEGLRRVRQHGAASASLYVDGLNPTRAYDVYRRMGFEVGYRYEVFEVRWE